MNALLKPPFVKALGAVLGAVLLLLAVLLLPSIAAVTPVDFSGFTGAGFAPSPSAGQLDSDNWRVTGLSEGDGSFGGTHTAGDFARGASDGGVTTGGVYAFYVITSPVTNTILGIQPSTDDFTSGDIRLRVQNATGAQITQLYVSYKIWTYNDQDRSNSLNLAYSINDTVYTDVSALDFTTPSTADPSPFWSCITNTTTITSLSLANNDYFYLRWEGNDVGGSGARDEYGIDDVEVRVNGPTAVTLARLKADSEVLWAVLALAGLLMGALVMLRRRA